MTLNTVPPPLIPPMHNCAMYAAHTIFRLCGIEQESLDSISGSQSGGQSGGAIGTGVSGIPVGNVLYAVIVHKRSRSHNRTQR